MRWIKLGVILWAIGFSWASQKPMAEVTGFITSAAVGHPLVGVNILVKGTYLGTVSDSSGHFKLDLAPGHYTLLFSMIGYRSYTQKIDLAAGQTVVLKIALKTDVLASPGVVVTSSRKRQEVLDSPISVSVLGPRRLKEQVVLNLVEAMPFVAGINTVKGQLNIRGSSGYTMGAGSRSLLLLDGVPMLGSASGNITWEVIPVSEIERVEIVKSGGSALYGSSAMGGVVNIITRNPPSVSETRWRVQSGWYSQPRFAAWHWRERPGLIYDVEISHSQPWRQHNFWFQTQGYHSDGFARLNWTTRWNLAAKAKLNFSTSQSAGVFFNYLYDIGGLASQWKSATEPFEAPPGAENDEIEGTKLILNGYYNWIYSPTGVMRLRSAFYKVDWQNHGTNNDFSHERKFFAEYQINTDWSSKLTTIAGLTAQRAQVEARIFGTHVQWSQAVYALLQGQLRRSFTLTLGGRWEGYEVDGEPQGTLIAPQLALNWRPLKQGSLRMSIGKGFRVPTVAEMFTSSRLSIFQVQPNPDLNAETGTTREVGFSVELPAWGLFMGGLFEGAWFRNTFSNLIEPTPDDEGIIHFENITNARIQGVESEVTLAFYPGLRFQSAYTYLDPVSLNPDGSIKDTLAYRYRHHWTSRLLFKFWQLGAVVEYRYASPLEKVALYPENPKTGADRQVPVSVWNGGLSFAGKGWELQLRVNNLFQYYYTQLEHNIAEERNFTITVSRKF